MIEREAVGYAAAAVVASDAELGEAQMLHYRHHVLRHGALGVRRMVRSGRRAATTAIAAQVGTDYGEAAGEQRRDVAPHQVRLREAVQQQDRRARAEAAHMDARFGRLHFKRVEILESQ